MNNQQDTEPSPVLPMFEKAFSFVEAALENGFSKDTCLRGFGNKWEQKISEVIGEEGRSDTTKNLNERIASAKEKRRKTICEPCQSPEKEY